MAKNRERQKIFQSKSSFSEGRCRANLLLLSRLGASEVYLSGDSRPSPANRQRDAVIYRVYLSGDSRPSPAG